MIVRPLLPLLATALGLALIGCSAKIPKDYQPEAGDIVFQSLPNPPGMDLVDAIEGATGSPYSHCGMVFRDDASGEWKVIEAIGPVKETPLTDFIVRGRRHKLWVYRPSAELQRSAPEALAAMRRDLGKPYDPRYRFDEEAIYCSELIRRGWEAATGRKLGQDVTLGSLNWEPYRKVITAIEGPGDPPLDRLMITPRDLAQDPELRRVYPAP